MNLTVVNLDDLKAVMSDVAVEISSANTFPEIMTVSQVADFLGVSKPTVYSRMKKGLPYSEKLGDPRFIKTEVLKWLKENE